MQLNPLIQNHQENAVTHLNAAMKTGMDARAFWAAATQIPKGPERDILCNKAKELEKTAQTQWDNYQKEEAAAKKLRESAKEINREARRKRIRRILSLWFNQQNT